MLASADSNDMNNAEGEKQIFCSWWKLPNELCAKILSYLFVDPVVYIRVKDLVNDHTYVPAFAEKVPRSSRKTLIDHPSFQLFTTRQSLLDILLVSKRFVDRETAFRLLLNKSRLKCDVWPDEVTVCAAIPEIYRNSIRTIRTTPLASHGRISNIIKDKTGAIRKYVDIANLKRMFPNLELFQFRWPHLMSHIPIFISHQSQFLKQAKHYAAFKHESIFGL